MDMVVGAHPPENTPEGDEEETSDEEPETVFGFHDAVVSACEFDDEFVAVDTRVD